MSNNIFGKIIRKIMAAICRVPFRKRVWYNYRAMLSSDHLAGRDFVEIFDENGHYIDCPGVGGTLVYNVNGARYLYLVIDFKNESRNRDWLYDSDYIHPVIEFVRPLRNTDLNMTRKAHIQIHTNLYAVGLDITYAGIPWCEHERIFNEYYAPRYGHSQSAERINARGGFGVEEAIMLGYDNPLVIWVAGKNYPKKDSDWTKLALQFNLEKNTYRWRILTEEEYQSLDLFERIKEEYDRP